MENPTNSVVDPAVVREGLMPALMCQNPQPCQRKREIHGVKEPGDTSEVDIANKWNGVLCSGHTGNDNGNISEDVVETLTESTFVAVLRNGLEDLLDGVIWRSEGFALCGDALEIHSGLFLCGGDGIRHLEEEQAVLT